ncbi:MAG TPA: hypothetical protein VEX43_05925 [Chthoniobacterales bacterium]|nr:hypothetical protein [Chthoniobacterales bacterium]
MTINFRLVLLAALVATGVSCDRKPPAADPGTDDAKLRPEMAVARKGASPTPMPDEAKASPTPAP